jgi:hypothetical protein
VAVDAGSLLSSLSTVVHSAVSSTTSSPHLHFNIPSAGLSLLHLFF